MLASVVLGACSSAAVHSHPGPGGSLVVTGESEDVNSVPKCSWPLNVSGQTSSAQTGLIRCYVRALAQRSLKDLAPLVSVHSGAPITLTSVDLAHAPDAMAGTATAIFTLNASDPFSASVAIHYANGAQNAVYMDAMNVTEPASHSWRLDLGTSPPDLSAPPSAATG
jgi:hypothetical protein